MTNKTIYKKLVSVASIAILCVSLTACGQSSTDSTDKNETGESTIVTPTLSDTPKEFVTDEISITLNDDFKEDKIDNYTFYYASDYCVCLGLRETKAELAAAGCPADDINQYISKIMEASHISTEVSDYNDSTKYFTWDKTIGESDYSYAAFVTQANDTYYLVQFVSLSNIFDDLMDNFESFYSSFKIS